MCLGSIRLNPLLGKTTAGPYLIKSCIFHRDSLRLILLHVIQSGGRNQYWISTIFFTVNSFEGEEE
jgi:hypothetical protein